MILRTVISDYLIIHYLLINFSRKTKHLNITFLDKKMSISNYVMFVTLLNTKMII